MEEHAERKAIEEVGSALTSRGIVPAKIAIVLGSGLKDFGERLRAPIELPFDEIPGLPGTSVIGHGASLLQGTLGCTRLHVLTGRVHLYEGYDPSTVVRAVRSLAHLGDRIFLLTNAAGGIREDLGPGDLMRIVDHLNLTGRNPLIGPADSSLGPRFPALSSVYDDEIGQILASCDPEASLQQGVYAQVLGPSYETPAEVRMLRTLGGDAVGMSTVPEAVALSAMGCRVAALSLITNKAAGLSAEAPRHDEVVAEGKKAAARMAQLLERALPEIAALD